MGKPMNGNCTNILERPLGIFLGTKKKSINSSSSQRLPRSLASLEAKKSLIIAFCWKADPSISESLLRNLYREKYLCAKQIEADLSAQLSS